MNRSGPDWTVLLERVSSILLHYWDPASMRNSRRKYADVPVLYDEYGSYAGPIVGLLRDGKSQEDIAAHLTRVVVDTMGLEPVPDNDLAVARILKSEFLRWSCPQDSLEDEVVAANKALPLSGLVTAHSGNVSGLDRKCGAVFIKPSGVDYGRLDVIDIAVVDLETGKHLAGLKPSVDLPHHLFLYRRMPEVGGIVHTHSNFATAFAANGLPIPPVLTAIADEFGGEIPCAPYVDNEGDHIGQAILAHKNDRAPAVLLANHGVFAWGPTPAAALKAAVMVEDTAKTVYLARQLGDPQQLPKEEVEKWWDRYQNRYGQ